MDNRTQNGSALITEEQFIRRWRCHIAGLALHGLVSEVRETSLQRGARVLDIPDETEKLLAAMYRSMHQTAHTNGHAEKSGGAGNNRVSGNGHSAAHASR